MNAFQKIALRLNRLSVQLNKWGLFAAIFAVVVMVLSASWQVIARYVLSQPPIWTEELSRFSMVWAGMMGASCAFRFKADPTLFPDALQMTGVLGALATSLRSLGALVFVVTTIWFCIFGPGMNPARGYIARLLGRQAETMDVPMIVFGISIPLALSFIIVHALADLASLLLPPHARGMTANKEHFE